MATTSLLFGDSTLLGMTSATQISHASATRASFAALPTVSYSGTGPASGSEFTVAVSISSYTDAFPNPSGVVYITSLGATGQATILGGGSISAGYSFGVGTAVIFTSSSSADLQAFLRGIYIGDTAPLSVSDHFKLNLQFDDGAGQGGTALYYDVACYLRGTGIATAQGDVAVEDLRIGDMLRTASGALKPVKFIGTQSFEAEFIAATPSQRPVLIRKDAIGEGLPARDLSVSAMHSLYIDDVLVPAVALVNGVSIVRADAPDGVEYFHIELDRHEVILAEGLPAESFIDDQSRAIFDNAFEYEALYGEGERIAPVAPRIEEGYTVDTIRRRIAARAGVAFAATAAPMSTVGHVERLQDGLLQGWVMNQDAADAAVELDILLDGEVVGRTIANRYRTDLDHAGLAGGRCGFTMMLPAAATSLDQVQVRIAATGIDLRKAAPMVAAV